MSFPFESFVVVGVILMMKFDGVSKTIPTFPSLTSTKAFKRVSMGHFNKAALKYCRNFCNIGWYGMYDGESHLTHYDMKAGVIH